VLERETSSLKNGQELTEQSLSPRPKEHRGIRRHAHQAIWIADGLATGGPKSASGGSRFNSRGETDLEKGDIWASIAGAPGTGPSACKISTPVGTSAPVPMYAEVLQKRARPWKPEARAAGEREGALKLEVGKNSLHNEWWWP